MLGFWKGKVLGARGICAEFIEQKQVAWKITCTSEADS